MLFNPFIHWIEAKGVFAPWLFLALFLAGSLLMIWRLEALSARGFEGTVLGTLVMPYCSGLGNLIFAFDYGRLHQDGGDVMINSLVNNVSNMTLILGVPAIIWGMTVIPKQEPEKGKKRGGAEGSVHSVNRLSLLFTLVAILFFTGVVWAMSRKGRLDFNDGLVLVGLFLFWQCIHIFEVLKQDARQGKSVFGWMFPVDLALLAAGAYGIYVSTDWFVHWVGNTVHHGFVQQHPGWVSGWVMALPNALLAVYYSWRKQPEVAYTSQVGDAHVSIPLCVGIYALFHPMTMPTFFHTGMELLLGATVVHIVFVTLMGSLPRIVGAGLVAAYAYFLWKGLLG